MTITTSGLPMEAIRLARTDTRTHALHLVECPHLVGRHWHDASDAERAGLPLCSWSRDQLDGHGRVHPDTLVEAMREHGTPAAAVPDIVEELADVEYDEIWLPYSRSYVALGRAGRAVASFGKTWVWVQGRGQVQLPGYTEVSRGDHAKAPTHGAVCATCHLEVPLTGVCIDCH